MGVQNVTLNACEARVLMFDWETTGVPISNYTPGALASPNPGEIDTQNKNYILAEQIELIPEFPSDLVLVATSTISTLAVASFRRKHASS